VSTHTATGDGELISDDETPPSEYSVRGTPGRTPYHPGESFEQENDVDKEEGSSKEETVNEPPFQTEDSEKEADEGEETLGMSTKEETSPPPDVTPPRHSSKRDIRINSHAVKREPNQMAGVKTWSWARETRGTPSVPLTDIPLGVKAKQELDNIVEPVNVYSFQLAFIGCFSSLNKCEVVQACRASRVFGEKESRCHGYGRIGELVTCDKCGSTSLGIVSDKWAIRCSLTVVQFSRDGKMVEPTSFDLVCTLTLKNGHLAKVLESNHCTNGYTFAKALSDCKQKFSDGNKSSATITHQNLLVGAVRTRISMNKGDGIQTAKRFPAFTMVVQHNHNRDKEITSLVLLSATPRPTDCFMMTIQDGHEVGSFHGPLQLE